MGFFSKSSKPSTAEAPAAPVQMVEKPTDSQLERGADGHVVNGIHITPELEARVVRKLDLHLPFLVMGLCMHASFQLSFCGFFKDLMTDIWIKTFSPTWTDRTLGESIFFIHPRHMT